MASIIVELSYGFLNLEESGIRIKQNRKKKGFAWVSPWVLI